MWLAAFAVRFELFAGRKNLHMQPIIAHEGNDFSIGIESVFTKHWPGGKSFSVAELPENEFNGFFLRGHTPFQNRFNARTIREF